MILIIPFVAQRMFPKTPLPNAAPAMLPPCPRHRLFNPAQGQPMLRKMFFDNAPAFGIIAIAGWHRPNGVDMVRQDNQGLDMKRQTELAMADGRPQTVPRRIIRQDCRPPFGHHREKIRPARHIATPIISQTTTPSYSFIRSIAQ